MEHFQLFDYYFEIYHKHIKKKVDVDEYLDWLNMLPANYRSCYSQFGFNETKEDNAFAWHCLENRNWFLVDFIGYSEPEGGVS